MTNEEVAKTLAEWASIFGCGASVNASRSDQPAVESVKNFADMLKREMQNLSWCDYRGGHYFLVDESFVDNVLKKFTEENSNA